MHFTIFTGSSVYLTLSHRKIIFSITKTDFAVEMFKVGFTFFWDILYFRRWSPHQRQGLGHVQLAYRGHSFYRTVAVLAVVIANLSRAFTMYKVASDEDTATV